MNRAYQIIFCAVFLNFSSCLKPDLQDFPIEKDIWKRGLVIDTAHYRRTPPAPIPKPSPDKPLPLPALYDMTSYFPPIDEYGQGGIGSCVAWATGYCARSYMEKMKKGYSYNNDMNRIFSPNYIYNQIKISNDCNSGSNYENAFNLLINEGAATWAVMPYDNSCSTLPDNNQKQNAANYKIVGYKKVSFDLDEIKKFIYNDKPVLIAVGINETFKDAVKQNGEFIWKLDNDPTISGNGHAMVIVAYDNNRNLFKLYNSWGTGWGNNGFAWVTFEKLNQCLREAYIIE